MSNCFWHPHEACSSSHFRIINHTTKRCLHMKKEDRRGSLGGYGHILHRALLGLINT